MIERMGVNEHERGLPKIWRKLVTQRSLPQYTTLVCCRWLGQSKAPPFVGLCPPTAQNAIFKCGGLSSLHNKKMSLITWDIGFITMVNILLEAIMVRKSEMAPNRGSSVLF